MKTAFTLIELIVAIVIVAILSAVAIPQFSGIVASSKISSEVATATSVQTMLDSIHSDWVLNGVECEFEWGNDQRHLGGNDLNKYGYPTALEESGKDALTWLFPDSGGFVKKDEYQYYGPASNPDSGTDRCQNDKPCIGKYWEYDSEKGTFTLEEE